MSLAHRHTGRHRAARSAGARAARSAGARTARAATLGATGVIAALLVNATASTSTADPVDASVVAQALSVRLDLSARAARSSARVQPAADDALAAAQSVQQDEVLDIAAADAGVVPLSEVLGDLALAAPVAPPAAPPPAEAQAPAAPAPAAEPSAPPPGLDLSSFARAGASLGLGANAQRVYSAIRAAFDVDSFSGYRRGDMDHGSGRAVDAMISGSAQGDAIAAFVLAHAKELNVKYVIWRQRIYNMDRPGWRGMANRGSATANHYDHVHISVY